MAPFGAAIDKMTIWRAVQKTGEEIAFSLDPKGGEARGEADGTGIGIKGIKKRGKELKVLIQYMKGGAIRVAGIDIGSYNGNWNRLFKQSLKALKEFKTFFLVTDGDTSILDGLKGKVKVLYQRCLWHIPHQLKFALWQDKAKVARKSPEWFSVMGRIYDIVGLRSGIDSDEEIQALIETKKNPSTLSSQTVGQRSTNMSSPTSRMRRTTFLPDSRTSSQERRAAASSGCSEP